MVVTLRTMDKDKNTVYDVLMKQFSLSPNEAAHKVELYWNQENTQS